LRGLPGGTTLARLLAAKRGARNRTNLPRLSVRRIIQWAKTHRNKTGSWPHRDSGAVIGVPGETWFAVHRALASGNRGLSGGSSLPQLLASEVGARNHMALPPFTIDQILAWADNHFAQTGSWPRSDSGPILRAPGETWAVVNTALHHGLRGLRGDTSLFRLLKKHRKILGPRPSIRVRQISMGRGRKLIRIELPEEWLKRFRSRELNPSELADRCKVSLSVARRELRRHGITPRPPGVPPGSGRPAWHTEILNRYRSGQTVKKVAEAMELKKHQVSSILRRYRVKMRPRGGEPFIRDMTLDEAVQLARRIRKLRRASGLTRAAVADRGGPSVSVLQGIERATAHPTRKIMCRLARALGVSMSDLMPSD
jgi:hypothetical protein